MKIIYATQTGNCADVAERIWRRLKCLQYNVSISDILDYDISELVSEEFVVFVCSTTGQGECPDDMLSFWKFLLRKNLPNNSLCNLNYGVIGLGDSSYDKFNVVAKKLSKRLVQLGANMCFPVILCDDQHDLGYDAAFQPWFEEFLKTTLPCYYPTPNHDMDNEYLLPPKYKIHFISKEESKTANNQKNGIIHYSNKKTNIATVKSNSRVTATDHFQDVRLVEFLVGEEICYKPGDVVVLKPENDPDNVTEFISLINAPLDEPFTLEATDSTTQLPKDLPEPCTLRNCITSYWDIQGIPRRSFFDILWHFSKCDMELEKLKEFTTAEGQDELYSYCNRPRRNTLEVLQEFPNTTPHIPVDYLFDLIPGIRQRSFSIASSLKYHLNEIHVLVAVVKYKTKLMKPRKGLCSTWLSKLSSGTEVPFSLKSGSVTIPANDCPVIMIGPGTGCAPFRSFVEERYLNGMKNNNLFFGCRYKDKDFLCKEDWHNFSETGFLKLFTAFSRDQEDKIYVQHRMSEEGGYLWNLINHMDAVTYIAGNSKNMPTDVKRVLLEIFAKEGGLEESDSKIYLQNLESSKRLMIETWS